MKIKGKRALITGGSGGLAAAAAKVLHAEGVHLTLTDMDADETRKQAEALGSDVDHMAADLTKTADIDKLAAAMKDKGGVDILVHAAGVTGEKGDP